MVRTTILKLTTADCIRCICKTYQGDGYLSNSKNWRRVSKKGNKTKGFLREFRNKEDDEIRIFVKSNEHDVTEVIRRRTPINILGDNPDILPPISDNPAESELYAIIQRICEEADDLSISDIIYGLPFASLPMIIPEGGGRIDAEEVDFENCEILQLAPNAITIAAGGDWQEPIIFTSILRDGQLHPANGIPGYRQGQSISTIVTQVYGDVPNHIRSKLG